MSNYDDEDDKILNVVLRAQGLPEISEDEHRREKRRQVVAVAVLIVLGSASLFLPKLDGETDALALVAWLGCAGGILVAAFNLRQVRAIFSK